MLEYVVYRTTGLEYIFQLLLPKMSVEANVRRFLRHSLVCATRLWGTLSRRLHHDLKRKQKKRLSPSPLLHISSFIIIHSDHPHGTEREMY
jgi:hypothetical protein